MHKRFRHYWTLIASELENKNGGFYFLQRGNSGKDNLLTPIPLAHGVKFKAMT